MTGTTLQMPKFFRPEWAGLWDYRPDLAKLEAAAVEESARRPDLIRPSCEDEVRVALLLIDMQPDFCHPAGALPVLGRSGEGALMDSRRVAELILRNAPRFTEIIATADTHNQLQAFFPSGWRLLGTGMMPEPHTLIVIEGGKLVSRALDGTILGEVVPDLGLLRGSVDRDLEWLIEQMKFYERTLAENDRPPLYLWPYHCIDGTSGQGIMPIVHEAMLYHGFLRRTSPRIVRKGMHPLTEHYSVFRPEVTKTYDGFRLVPDGSELMETLVNGFHAVVVAGEASSHCVAASLDHVIEFYASEPYRGRPENFYVLTDCMSPVVVQGADFSAEAEAALKRCEEAGMHLVQSTTPMEEWPDFPGI
jgi:nicotinamidase-related amidase